MLPIVNKIKIEKTVRYFTIGNADSAENIWIILHGYSQLPYYFIQKFKNLDLEKNYIVAPEGFHRFYRKGTKGRVGASWMTKEARLDDIDDNILYLDKLAVEVLENRNFKQRILLGFSQGGATASRWHHLGIFKADIFILWACVFADDLSLENNKVGMFTSKNYFVMGNEDEYLKDSVSEILDFFKHQPFQTKTIIFKGNHDIDIKTLDSIAKEITIE